MSNRWDQLNDELETLGAKIAALESAHGFGQKRLTQAVSRQLEVLAAECAEAADDEPMVAYLRMRVRCCQAALGATTDVTADVVAGFDEVVDLGETVLSSDGWSGHPWPAELRQQAVWLTVQACTDAAQMCLLLGDFGGVEDRLRRVERIGELSEEPWLTLSVLNTWTSLALQRGRASEAFARAQMAMSAADQVHDEAGRVSALINLANACWRMNDRAVARDLSQQILEYQHLTVTEELSARLIFALSWMDDDPRRAVELLTEVLNLAGRANIAAAYHQAALAMGVLALHDNQPDPARQWLIAAASVAVNASERANCLIMLARTLDPDLTEAEQLRDEAKSLVADDPWARVPIHYLSLLSQWTGTNHAELLDEILPLGLIMDLWRIEVPWGVGRTLWQDTTEAGSIGLGLTWAADGGHADLVAAISAHVCAIPPVSAESDPELPLPPVVRIDGVDPLSGLDEIARRDFKFRLRDDSRQVELWPTDDGVIDLFVVSRLAHHLTWRGAGEGAWRTVAVSRNEVDELVSTLLSSATNFPTGVGNVLVDATLESELMTALGRAVLAEELLTDLDNAARGHSRPPLLRIRADGEFALIPWGLLVCHDTGERLGQRVDLVTLAPLGLTNHAENVPAEPPTATSMGHTPEPRWVGGAVVAVIDPPVPGVPRDSALGPILGDGDSRRLWQERLVSYQEQGKLAGAAPVEGESFVQRSDQDRRWLAAALRTNPARLLCVAHVSTIPLENDPFASEAALHLACGESETGHGTALPAHRPLVASDILDPSILGDFPARVGIVGCASSNDAHLRDAYGLTHACLTRGAHLVTGLRWPVPTLQWYRDQWSSVDGSLGQSGHELTADPLADLTVAVDDAHESPDPVAALADWQRSKLRRWQETGALEDCPLGWAGLHTVIAAYPASAVTDAG